MIVELFEKFLIMLITKTVFKIQKYNFYRLIINLFTKLEQNIITSKYILIFFFFPNRSFLLKKLFIGNIIKKKKNR